MNFNEYTRTALTAARAGGEVLARHFNRSLRIEYKGRIDPVTVADRQSQQAVRKVILKAFPGHTVMGEEDIGRQDCTDYCWIVDPLDGTVNFIHGVPFFSVSVALHFRGKVICGVVHAPFLDETFIAEKGCGAWLNGKRLRVSKISSLVRSLVVTGLPYYIHRKPQAVVRTLVTVAARVQGLRRIGSAALDLAYVAAGRFEAFWEEGLKPWDVAAGALLVQEAGGRVTDFRNGHDYVFGQKIVASNGRLHAAVLRLLKK